MSKILVIADVHINDYSNRNPSNKFRLYQGSRTVAHNIIDVAKREGCDYIVLAGDIVDKATPRAYVLSEVKLFLDTIMSHFKEGFLILGNHDLDNKGSDQDLNDSVLGVMLPSNLHYAHQKIINLEGTTFGFCNWMPEDFDLTWIPNKVDVLFTHATICYDPNNDGLYKSQSLDETKFDIAFCGDIHRRAQKDKYVSIGCTQRCKLGDSDESSGIVFDCSTKSWGWVNLDPYNNLLKFDITDNLDEEGYKPETNTWYVYKDPSSLMSYNDANIKIDAWTEIEGLINQAIIKSNLQVVHQEVLNNISNIDENEVDFNFTLKKLHCVNWRSITDATIDFTSGGNKIRLLGSNGSGKSSLLSAIKYAFIDCGTVGTTGVLSLKSFIQFGKKDCLTEVEFEYQGNDYKLTRGTKTYGLEINGEVQKYNNKRLFEQDVRDRFKFINYINDVLMFDSDKSRFIGSLSPERLTEIISKFLKLDRLDTINDVAGLMLENLKDERRSWTNKASEVERVLSYIQEKLNLITLPELSLQQLEQLKQEGLELQRKNSLWNQYVTKSASLQARIETYTNTLNELIGKSRTFRDVNFIDQEIDQYNKEIENLNSRLIELGNIRVNLDYKTRECNNLRQEGNRYWIEAKNIGTSKHCSYCGQEIKNTESIENHKNELLRKVEELKPQIQELQKEINELTDLRNNSEQEYNKINQDIKLYNSEISKRLAEKNEISATNTKIEQTESLLQQAKVELGSLGYVERVDLPSDFMQRMGNIESGISVWKSWESNKNDESQKLIELNNLKKEIEKIDTCLDQLNSYYTITGSTGIIYEEIMNKLAKSYSDNMVEYIVIRSRRGNKEHLGLVPTLKKGKEKIPYDMCSSGEKTILDIHMLEKLIPNSGLLILDEFLKNLDSEKTDIVCEILKNMRINTLILTSHATDLTTFYDRTISLSLNDQGLTEIK